MAECEADPRWEFDAPKFYDFSRLDAVPAPADEWFATAPDGPGTRPKGAAREPTGGWAHAPACAYDLLTMRGPHGPGAGMAQVTAPEGAREALAEIQQPSSKAAAPPAEPGGKVRLPHGVRCQDGGGDAARAPAAAWMRAVDRP